MQAHLCSTLVALQLLSRSWTGGSELNSVRELAPRTRAMGEEQEDQAAAQSQKAAAERVAKSKLYADVPSHKQPILYSSNYDVTFFGLEKLHPFDSTKWRRCSNFLQEGGQLKKGEAVEAREATESDLLLAHTPEYLKSLRSSVTCAQITELPFVAMLPNWLVQRRLLRPFRFQAGGTVLAGKLAKERGWAINIGGGFHHCCGYQGGGFCAYADITLAIKFAMERLNVERVMIIDLDAHQGNGHERDFLDDKRVYIFDMYNMDIYPRDQSAKRAISRAVELSSGTETEEYLGLLRSNLEASFKDFSPDLLVYNAGTDVLTGDPLGGLHVSEEGVVARDEIVFQQARGRNIPVVMVTSGGYQQSNARLIADSIANLAAKKLISLEPGRGS